MAAPLTAAAFLAALRAEGVKVVEVTGWRTHNRNHVGAWGPVYGSIVHHTVTKGTANTVRICRDGYASLPGPLCHGVIAKDGTVHLVGYGRANHAGGGDQVVLRQVQDETYGDRPTPPTKGNADGLQGNAYFYGWECENLGDGKDPWPAAQYDAIVRTQAAICRAHRWSAKSSIGHREWSQDKVDPRGVDMPDLRADVAERLRHPADWAPGSPTPSVPQKEEDDMALTVEERRVLDEIRELALDYHGKLADGSEDPRDVYEYIRSTRRAVDTLAAKVGSLAPGLTALQLQALAAQVSTSATLAESIAELVADKLAARLAE